MEAPTSWLWFQCINTQKCIHIDSRCDMHPNPACIYEKDGIMVAEDEEGCFDEYKRKNLVSKEVNVICSSGSLYHNTMSPAVMASTWDELNYEYIDMIVIPTGTSVQIPGIRCDGILNCWDGIDEKDCGMTFLQTVGIGKQFKNLEAMKDPFRHKLPFSRTNCLMICYPKLFFVSLNSN